MEQIGWFVVGDGNFGPFLFVDNKNCPPFVSSVDDTDDISYWKNRGYDIIPAYINSVDKENYSFVEENNDNSS